MAGLGLFRAMLRTFGLYFPAVVSKASLHTPVMRLNYDCIALSYDYDTMKTCIMSVAHGLPLKARVVAVRALLHSEVLGLFTNHQTL